MKELITLSDGEIRLTSNLDEYSFGKTNYDSIVTQEGFLFDGRTFTSWTFSDVKSFNIEGEKDRIVFYCGKNPLSENAKTLLQYYDLNDDSTFRAVSAVCKAYTQAAQDDFPLPPLGAGGILVDLKENSEKILFLPEGLFSNTVSGLKAEEYLQEAGGWINRTIYKLPAICFERAVLVYKLLTKRLPYANPDQIERNADILDQNFLPLELSVKGINPKLAKEVNKALKLNSNVVNIPGKKQKGKNSEDLTPTKEFPLELLEEAWKLSKENSLDDKDFQEKAASYMKIKNSKVTTKRRIRRNSAKIGVGIALIIIFTYITINTVKTSKDRYTSIGLTSTQTIQGFFMGVNVKDPTTLSEFVKGKKPQSYVDTISQIYVLTKQRKLYDKDNGFASPANWLIFSTTPERYSRSGIYGITNLKIDGKPYDITTKIYKKNQNPEVLTKEGNINLSNKDKSVHKVEYFLIHSEGENQDFIVEKVTDIFTLTYTKNRWLITDIQTESENLQVKSKTFKNDYMNELLLTEGDVISAAENLRSKYPWLPSKTDLTEEMELMEWNLSHPFDQKDFMFE